MRCSLIRKKLYKYADGEGKVSEREAIAQHLITCTLCQQELEEIQALNHQLIQTNIPDIPSHIHEKIMFEIKSKVQKKKFVHKGLRWNLVPVAASLAISLYFGVFLGAKTLPLTVAQMEISSVDFGQQTIDADDNSQELTK